MTIHMNSTLSVAVSPTLTYVTDWIKLSDHKDLNWKMSIIWEAGTNFNTAVYGPGFESSKNGIDIDSTSTGLLTGDVVTLPSAGLPLRKEGLHYTMQGLVDDLESRSAWSPGPKPVIETDYIRMYVYASLGTAVMPTQITSDFIDEAAVAAITTDSVLVSTIADDVRRRLSDVSDLSFDDTTLIAWINEGARTFSVLTGCCQDIATSTTNQSDFSMNTLTGKEFIRAYTVLVNGTPMDYVRRNHMRTTFDSASGTPKAWTQWGNEVRLDKTLPDDQTLEVWYSFIPNTVTQLSDSVTIDRKYINGVVSYVTYRALSSDRDGGMASRAYQEYLDFSSLVDQDVTARIQRGGFR